MKQNERVEVLSSNRFDRIKRSVNLNRRTSIAATTATAAVLLIVGGIAFAGTTTSGPQTINQAASLFPSASPSNSQTSSNSSSINSGSSKSGTPAAPSQSTSQSNTNSLTTPSTIIGPKGETVVVSPTTPANTKTNNNNPTPSNTGTTTPTTVKNSSVPSGPSATTVPASATPTTTARILSINGSDVPTATVNAVSDPEDPAVTLSIKGGDDDGYVTSIAIDWNDGSTPTVYQYDLSACSEPESSLHSVSPSHTYSDAAQYKISVTTTSMNCTGDTTQTQQKFAFTTVTTGGTNTPPVTTVSGL